MHIMLSYFLVFVLGLCLRRHREHFCKTDPMNALFFCNYRAVMLVLCNKVEKHKLRKCGPCPLYTHLY